MLQVVGHRGAAGNAPENTLTGFRTAIELGADVIEFDIRTSSEGVPVVIHDEAVDAVTDGSGVVEDLTVEELKTLDVEGNETIPTLEEALAFLAGTHVGVMIEPKEVGLAERVLESVETHDLADRTSVVSFDHEVMRGFVDAGVSESITAEFATGDPPGETFFEAAEALGCSRISIDMGAATRELVKEARNRGFDVGLFTPNDPDEIEEVLSLGPDYVCSDYPERVVEQV